MSGNPPSNTSNQCSAGGSGATLEPPKQLRTFPIRIYLARPVGDEVPIVQETIHDVCHELGLEVIAERPAEYGSWFKWLLGRTKDAITSQKAKEIAAKAQEAAELHYLKGPQAAIDETQLKYLPELLRATENDDIVLQLGLLMVVTLHNPNTGRRRVMVKSLSELQLSAIEKYPHAFRDPQLMLAAFDHFDSGGNPGSLSLPVPDKPLQPQKQ